MDAPIGFSRITKPKVDQHEKTPGTKEANWEKKEEITQKRREVLGLL